MSPINPFKSDIDIKNTDVYEIGLNDNDKDNTNKYYYTNNDIGSVNYSNNGNDNSKINNNVEDINSMNNEKKDNNEDDYHENLPRKSVYKKRNSNPIIIPIEDFEKDEIYDKLAGSYHSEKVLGYLQSGMSL